MLSSSSASGNIYGRKLLPVLPPCVGAVEQFNAALEEVSGDEQQRPTRVVDPAGSRAARDFTARYND
jgi:hypothetical protein